MFSLACLRNASLGKKRFYSMYILGLRYVFPLSTRIPNVLTDRITNLKPKTHHEVFSLEAILRSLKINLFSLLTYYHFDLFLWILILICTSISHRNCTPDEHWVFSQVIKNSPIIFLSTSQQRHTVCTVSGHN